MSDPKPTEVLVIGAGMAGGAISKILAQAGVRVVCLEQGDWVRAEQYPHDDRLYELHFQHHWHPNPNSRKLEADYPVCTDDIGPALYNAVGGSTIHYQGAWPRMRPSDFRRGTEHGLAPDWPFIYEDLAPFYEINDREMGVSGITGDPAYPPRERRQTPPAPFGALGRRAARAFEKLGWHWWPLDLAIITEDYEGRLACNNCGNCKSGCQRQSIATSANTYWPKAIRAGAELRTGCAVQQIVTDSSGKAIGAVYIEQKTGARRFQKADVVVICCNGIGTPRLLLTSNERNPNGLANRNGLVGRYLMHHVFSEVDVWTEEYLESHKGALLGPIYSAEFAESDTSRGFVNGVTLLTARQNGPAFQALGAYSRQNAPWGAKHHEWFLKHFGRGFMILVQCEDLPSPDNRVVLDAEVTDRHGLPAPRVYYKLHPNDRKLLDFGIERALEVARAADATEVYVNTHKTPERDYHAPAFHLLGSCRMGIDPETSVTDPWHRSWEVPNLYICDGSSMPTSGAVNPTSTIAAMAVRCAHGMLEHRGR